MTTGHAHCQRAREAAKYVLGELHGRQRDSFSRHLRRCDVCSEEVDLLRSAADAVPLLAARQLPPEGVDREPERYAPTLAAAVAEAASSPDAAGRGNAQARPRARLFQKPMPKPAMLGILGLALIGAVTIVLSHQAASIHFVRIRAGWTSAGGGGAALKLQGNQLELLVKDMPQPQPGDGYQVWTLSKSSKRLTATDSWLHLNSLGEAGAFLSGDYHDWAAIAVYVEPLHGRDTTKSGAVVVGDLRHEK